MSDFDADSTAPWCPECGPTCPLHGTADYDAATVCIAHGRFIPCRKDGEHRYTSNPYWAKAVMDYQGSPIEDLTWQPAWERPIPSAEKGQTNA